VTIDTRTDTHDGTRKGVLWAGVLVGPLASLTALELGYVLVERACASGQMLPVHLAFLGCFLATAATGWLSWREWQRWGSRLSSEAGGREGRSRFLATLGLIGAPLFGLVIVAQWSAVLFLHPCQ
jgi:hypothetical protein